MPDVDGVHLGLLTACDVCVVAGGAINDEDAVRAALVSSSSSNLQSAVCALS